MCFRVRKNGESPLFFNYDGYVVGTLNGKYIYGIYNGNILIGNLYFDINENRWEFWSLVSQIPGPSGSFFSYLNSTDDYPVSSVSAVWNNQPNVAYGLTESTIGSCHE
jgi:hypothetical protein